MRKPILLLFVIITGIISGCSSGSTSAYLKLDEKLTREYQRYENARQLVLLRYGDSSMPIEKQLISREEWEAILASPANEALSADDLGKLKARQMKQVQTARDFAIRSSLVDFAAWRDLPAEEGKERVRAFCIAVPKGGMLHVHPWGTLNQKTFKTLLERSNPNIRAAEFSRIMSDSQGPRFLYPPEIAWLNSLPAETSFLALPPEDRGRLVAMGALPAGAHPFERFEAIFNFVALAVGGNWENLVSAYDDFAERAVRSGLQYVEFTESINPEALPRYVQLADGLADKYRLIVRFNVAFFRTNSVAQQSAAVKAMLKEIDSPVVTGIDLLANELHTPTLETGQAVYGPVFAAKSLTGRRWRLTMHAGELGDVRNPRDALLLGAERLGHGVRLAEDPVTLQYAAEKHIPIEINLTSNLKLQAVSDIRSHPFLTYLRLGLPVSLSTDDEGIFSIDIIDECMLAVRQTDVTYFEFKEMAFNSIRASFASEDVKQKLLEELRVRFDRFEKHLNVSSVKGSQRQKPMPLSFPGGNAEVAAPAY